MSEIYVIFRTLEELKTGEEKEMEILQRDLKLVEESHGNQVLNLVLAGGYFAKLFVNSRIARYLGQHQADIFRELQVACEGSSKPQFQIHEKCDDRTWQSPLKRGIWLISEDH